MLLPGRLKRVTMDSKHWGVFFIHLRSVYLIACFQVILLSSLCSAFIIFCYSVRSSLIFWILTLVVIAYILSSQRSVIYKKLQRSGNIRILFTTDEVLFETYNIFSGYNISYICSLHEIAQINVLNNKSPAKIQCFVENNGIYEEKFNVKVEGKIYLKYITEYLIKHHHLRVNFERDPNTTYW